MKTWLMSLERELLNVDFVRRMYVNGPDVFADVDNAEPKELVRCADPAEAEALLVHLMIALGDPNYGVVFVTPVGNIVSMEGVLNDLRTNGGRTPNH